MARTFKIWLASLIATALFTLVSVAWLDRPIALFVHGMFGSRQITGDLGRSPILSIALVTSAVFFICGLAAIMGRRFRKSRRRSCCGYQRPGSLRRQERA